MSPNEQQPPKRNIDERIDALTMNLELTAAMQRDSDVRISARIDKIMTAVETLARIAEIHERRLSSLEGDSPA